MPEVIEHTHEDHDIELLAELCDVVDGELFQLDVQIENLRRQFRLREVPRIGINADDAIRSALLHLNGVEAAVAPYIENRLPTEVFRNRVGKPPPLELRIVSKE